MEKHHQKEKKRHRVRIDRVNPDESVVITLSRDELSLVTNSVFNAAQFIEERIYFTLMGFEKEDAHRFSDAAYSEELRVGLRQPPPAGWEKFR